MDDQGTPMIDDKEMRSMDDTILFIVTLVLVSLIAGQLTLSWLIQRMYQKLNQLMNEHELQREAKEFQILPCEEVSKAIRGKNDKETKKIDDKIEGYPKIDDAKGMANLEKMDDVAFANVLSQLPVKVRFVRIQS